MNDEEMVSRDEETTDLQTGDPLPETDPTDAALGSQNAENGDSDDMSGNSREQDETPTVSDDPVQDPDPVASTNLAEDPEDRVEQLRSELNRLRAEIAARDEALQRMGTECEEFRELYPDVSLSILPDSVWEDVRRGIPIAAAYALAERKQALTAQKAAVCNQTNTLRSAGRLAPTESDYFSPSEVRAMTQREVRANYQKIMRSMQKWH